MPLTPYHAAVARDAAARVAFCLPHEARRRLHRRVQPGEHQNFETMREHDLGEVEGQAVSLTEFDRREFIFVHVPKCGGMSVGQQIFGTYAGNHMPIPSYQLIFSAEEFDRYFKFSFVRNPFDRLVSAYRYMRNGGPGASGSPGEHRCEAGTTLTERVKTQVVSEVAAYDDFEHFVTEWLNRSNTRLYEHFRPQHRFVCSPDGQLQLDFVGRFERLTDDFGQIAERIGTKPVLPHENRSSNGAVDYAQMFTPATRRIAEKIYEKDLRMFDYTFGDHS